MRILTFSSLYPSSVQPSQGIFVENRLRELLRSGEVESRVMCPVPWAPWGSQLLSGYGVYREIEKQAVRHGVSVSYPRYFLIPKIGMTLAPGTMFLSLYWAVRKLIEDGYDFDLIDAHYFYPDGVAAAMIGRLLKKPVVITARGTDINLIPAYDLPRRQILWAAEQASGLITVCQALKDTLVEMGVAPAKIHALRNGVDLVRFQPQDRRDAKAAFGATAKTLLSVGHLIERKGHDLAIRALPELPDCQLLIAGDGPEGERLRSLADELGVTERVRFLGAVRPENMPQLYCAGDALILASSREGWANVLLEAMACGTPVVASNVWGTPEVVTSIEAGVLMHERTPQGVVQGVRRLFENLPARNETRRYAEDFSWDATTAGQMALFKKILQGR
ncbi:MAG: glycosyltransferase family 4 protein [Alphaproteobacteria bacterium]|nr:glycosyltransferase family 4 protein [Alphaproteobacteria bacterium]